MSIPSHPLKYEIVYPDSDGEPMAESDPARDYLLYSVEALDLYFQNRDDVYVSGNIFVYYKQGIPSAVISPDVLVVFGVEKKKRQSYKVWEEGGKVPDFVLEVTSSSTQENDEIDKPLKYAQLGVAEYFQYDPTGDYLQPQLKGSRLASGQYRPLQPTLFANGDLSIRSRVLGLDLRLIGREMRFYDPNAAKILPNYRERDRELQQEKQARRAAIPRLLDLGLTVEQVAETLSFSVEEVRQFLSN